MSIDSHIHLFKKSHLAIPTARHRPQYDAAFSTIRSLAAQESVEKFVLVQTSFMGTDNSHLLAHLHQFPTQFRGVFILDKSTSRDELRELKSQGVVGIRLNLFQTNLHESLSDEHIKLIDRCSLEGLSVGLHDDATRLIGILDRIEGRASRLVIDHFGRPESLAMAHDDPVFDQLLERMVRDNSYVKISAPYRSPNMNPEFAYQKLRRVLGEEKLLWASDWPWTQSENYLTYKHWVNPFTHASHTNDKPQRSLADRLANNSKLFYEFD